MKRKGDEKRRERRYEKRRKWKERGEMVSQCSGREVGPKNSTNSTD